MTRDFREADRSQTLRRFSLMKFNIAQSIIIIYDAETEQFTDTTLKSIEQAVIDVLQNLNETINRFTKMRFIMTCQNELLTAFPTHTRSQ
jgi:hypothetical protein